MASVQLLVVQGRPSGKRFRFPNGDYYIGRGTECQIRPDSEWVSRQHCLLRVAGDGVFLRDLGSRNGTLVNGHLLTGERRLEDGDRIQVGPLVFQVNMGAGDTGRGAAAQALGETVPVAPPKEPESPTPSRQTDPAKKPSPPG
jgi:pSer/pThr/pTyr-binding forkhead associated (FHA) protein